MTSNQIVLGSPEPMSGPYKVYGDLQLPGVKAVFDYTNAHGGINGRQIKWVLADSGCTDAAQGVAAGREVIQQDHAFMLVATQCPTVVNAINQTLLAGTKIFNLSITGAGRDFSKTANRPEKRGYFYSLNASTTSMMVDLMSWAVEKLHLKKFGVLAGTDSYGDDGITGVQAAVQHFGLPNPVVTHIDESSTDASVQVAQLKAAGVQAVLMPCFFNPAISAIRTMRSLGWNVPVLGASAAVGSISTVKAIGLSNMNLVWGAAQTKILIGDPRYQVQIQKYSTPDNPLNTTNVGATWTAEMAVAMLKRAGRNLTYDTFLKAVYAKPFVSPYYGTIDFKKAAGYAELQHCVTIYTWTGTSDNPTQKKTIYQCPAFKVPGLG